MAKSNAERQKLYRARCLQADSDRRLNTWLSASAELALKRLAKHHGRTQKEMLEHLIHAADEAILKTLDIDTVEWDTYFSRKRKASSR